MGRGSMADSGAACLPEGRCLMGSLTLQALAQPHLDHFCKSMGKTADTVQGWSLGGSRVMEVAHAGPQTSAPAPDPLSKRSSPGSNLLTAPPPINNQSSS